MCCANTFSVHLLSCNPLVSSLTLKQNTSFSLPSSLPISPVDPIHLPILTFLLKLCLRPQLYQVTFANQRATLPRTTRRLKADIYLSYCSWDPIPQFSTIFSSVAGTLLFPFSFMNPSPQITKTFFEKVPTCSFHTCNLDSDMDRYSANYQKRNIDTGQKHSFWPMIGSEKCARAIMVAQNLWE